VVASVALIAAFASVAVPGSAGLRAIKPIETPSADLFDARVVAAVRGPVSTPSIPDPGDRSAATLDRTSRLLEPDTASEPPQARPEAAQPTARPVTIATDAWRHDADVSWYGPGFYGKRTACGVAMTKTLLGVAHRSLPCGTKVTFRNPANGRVITVRVVDRGPFVGGRQWDLTGGLCRRLRHCYTGPLDWRLADS
jgi:rare lipoprotein A (peptidoglycan hydrolase)